MLGTLVNAGVIVVASLVGLLLRGGLKERYRGILSQAMALAVLFVGISGAVGSMVKPGANPVLYIISLAVGGLLGEALRIEGRLQGLGELLQGKMKKAGGGTFAQGFVAASLLFCVGTMAVLGAIESGVQGRHTILYTKSLIDGITALVMASTLGIGVAFSALSILLYQGALTLLAGWLSPFLSAEMLLELSIIGGILITAIGLNMLELTKIRVGNLLPALLGPVVYYGVLGLLK